ncbi:DUF1961 family protein [Paractinoplanes durhamensis]|uniref:DUF1961 family protein n=1 Tax=Paractinoplanes durhamensis TaxID=113563 RepID=A0ABQ3ZBW8_9ACTN|nr:DUF1961 family protein [Actinoplanes durhamensis]GIE07322.1 hypothetical protein Adu01nite_86720 [Actinoplanes durhamensis]
MLYHNRLGSAADIADFRMEGDGAVSFPRGRLRLESLRPPEDGQDANIVLWCPADFGPDITVTWDFWPIREPGLAILFFHARGRNGESIFDLAPRTGPYEQYHHGDLNAYHVSYFRRMWPSERRLHTCNLRKSYGFHLVAQGPDPLPAVLDAEGPYQMRLTIHRGVTSFEVAGLPSFRWTDPEPLPGGRIGFRQMAPMIGEYANLQVTAS